MDTHAGLCGVIVVVGSDAEYDGKSLFPADDTTEVFLHMCAMNEADNFHFERNVLRSQRNRCLTDEQLKALMENEDFEVSKLCILLPTLFTAMDPASILRKANLRASTFTIWALKV